MGRFVVLRDGREVDEAAYGGRKVRTLLRVLATRQGRFVPNDVLADALWPERPPADPAGNLQVLVNRARRAVGRPDLVRTGPGGYALAPEVVVDTEVFLAATARAAALDGPEALAAYREVLATDAEPLPEDTYAEWARPYRSRVLRARQDAWERAAALAIDAGEPALAVGFATAAAGADPLREVAALTLARALAAAGDRAAALAQLDAYRRAIADELGLDPSPATADLQRKLLASAPTAPAAPTEPAAPAEPARHPAGRPATAEVEAFGTLRFVGRDATVREAVAALSDGVVQVAGRSGTGKSRLLEAVASAAPAVSVAAYWADRDEPWSLARPLLRRILAEDGGTDTLPGRLRDALAHLLPELDPPATVFDPETRNALVIEAAARLLASAPGRVLLVDDLQWADPSSVRLLGAIAGRDGGPRMLLAYRPEELSPSTAELLRRLPGGPPLTLGALPEPALADLVDAPEVVAAIVAETDGTAMAVAEVLRTLHREGLARADRDGRWRVTSAEAAEVARRAARVGQRRAIAARVAAHPGAPATVLDLLAMLGREAPARVLAAANGLPEPQVLDLLAELAAADLVGLGEHGWRTAHDMVAEVVVAGLGEGGRGRLHARLATVLDEEDGDAAERARHWLGAGDAPKAARAYTRAAGLALDQLADAEAEGLADAGLAAAGQGPERVRLLEVRARARRRRGDIAAARDDLRAALDLHPSGPPRARVLAHLAALDSGADDLRRAADLAELALVEAGGDDGARADALEVASIIDMNLGRPDRAAERSAEALAIFTRTGDSRGAARILDARAMAAFLHGSIEAGVGELDRAAHLFEDSGDLMRMVTPRSTCGHGRVLMDIPAEGLTDTERALDVARALGHPEGQTYALWHRSEALSALGRAEEALAEGRAALAIAERLGHRGWTATAWRAIGLAHRAAGDPAAALDAFRESLAHSANLDLFGCWAAARAALACVDLGRLDEAADLVERAGPAGPALGRHEARWAAAALAVARSDPQAHLLVREAVAAATAAGARVYLPHLAELAARASPG